jgi:hypothetical protein
MSPVKVDDEIDDYMEDFEEPVAQSNKFAPKKVETPVKQKAPSPKVKPTKASIESLD